MTASRQPASWAPRDVLEKFLLGFEGTSLPHELRELLAGGLGGVAIYPRNFTSAEGLRLLTKEICCAAGEPVLIGIDQEGGTKFSLPEPFTQWVSPEELVQLNDEEAVEQQALARELRAVAVNLNFAPMLDLHVNPESPVTKGRSFGADPHRVSRLGAAFIRGMGEGEVLACGKHFPGHGDAQVDPHEDLPVLRRSEGELGRADWVPFAKAIQEKTMPLLMTAHILLPELDTEKPTSLSRRLVTGILRERIGFDGVILADDLGMGAISRRYGPGEAAVEAIRAGSDIVMLCHDWGLARPAIEKVAEVRARGGFAESEWQASRERMALIRRMLRNLEVFYGQPVIKEVGCVKHWELAAEIRTQLKK